VRLGRLSSRYVSHYRFVLCCEVLMSFFVFLWQHIPLFEIADEDPRGANKRRVPYSVWILFDANIVM
jgi:hypothetical protein